MVVLGLCIVLTSIVGLLITTTMLTKGYRRTIDRQQDTIERLINREPVTYAETGQKPTQPIKERYAAWGNQMINLDEDESRS